MEPTHLDENRNVVSMRRHDFDSFLAGKVCKRCNNGWMSALEGQCKEMILDLALGRRRLMSLCDKEALQLARWTVKTAFILHTTSNWRRIVPEEHIYSLDTESFRLPENVFVVGHTFKSSQKFSWSQGTTWEIFARGCEPSAKDLAIVQARGYKIALRIGGLFLMVFHNPLPQANTCLWKMRHIPLYPRWSHPVSWRVEDRAWPSNPEVRFLVFCHMLALSMDAKP